ncbi:hypothetical protein [Variovorax terrae]|uniref:Uncharacterized protein n=1 Tax=Variovorax terrae TaxID=2923278 RepID=A0A9X1VWH7_9BURK|nr:hypothetical protein [Variovorax terrae]MCJ0764530.1 hypothetical protein [Variovorax terrae]
MSGIDNVSQLTAVMRAQVAALRQSVRSAPSKSAPHAPNRTESGSSQEPLDLARLVAQRVQSLDPQDPQRKRKALRIFLETVLLAELGIKLANDPAFLTMVDTVHRQMEADSDLAKAMDDAAAILLSKSPDAAPE